MGCSMRSSCFRGQDPALRSGDHHAEGGTAAHGRPSSGGAAAIIALERWRPYDRGQPFLRDGFWVDLVTYALFQSYFLP
jgi:hypothetical protein